MHESLADEPTELGLIERRELGFYDPWRTGPTLAVVGGVHGNEPAGILALRRVLERLHEHRPESFRGRFVGLAGNLAALNHPDRHTRYVEADLNRLCTPGLLASDSEGPDLDEARGLTGALADERDRARGPFVVLDLHTVSSPSPPFIAMSDSLRARAVARHFPLPIFLAFEENLTGLLADYATTELGAVSMIVEGGQHDDPCSVEVLEAVVWTALHAAGILAIGDGPELDTDPREVLARAAGGYARGVFDIRYRCPIGRDGFAIEPGRRAMDKVRRHRTVIARDEAGPIDTPISGRLFMPNRQPARRVGDDGFFIAVEVGRMWLRLSAWLRRRPLVHRAIPALMPGVRRRPGREHDLLVAPEIAAVLRRQIFHLLGYRLIRSTPVEDLSRVRRVWRGVMAVGGAAWRMAAGFFVGGERGALPDERPEDWIVARRTLDIRPENDPG
ncbi:MAG: hypothetical protein DHS20C14_17640 [Phycisphaeraceae bacterium]|nr:MAG: hypothetical protein DHS20C14_17640 [Phycisphaeraceae bacterium]